MTHSCPDPRGVLTRAEVAQPGVTVFLDDDGEVHRGLDRPAVILPDGTQIWAKHGLKHRVAGPAVVRGDGTVENWVQGRLHAVHEPHDSAAHP